jgi:hypothetical protein
MIPKKICLRQSMILATGTPSLGRLLLRLQPNVPISPCNLNYMSPPHSYSSSERSIIQHTLRAHSCHRNPSAVMIQRQRRHWVKSAINSFSGSPGLLVESSRISLWNAVSFILASGLRMGISPTTISYQYIRPMTG